MSTSEVTAPPWTPTPARGYTNTVTHPPFEDGNEMATKHGAYSPRRVDPLATEILEATRLTVTWWRPADSAAAWAWARTEARCQLVTEWLMDNGGDVAADGNVRAAARLLDKLEARAESLRSKLGLDPLSRARLGRDVAAGSVDVARMMAVLEQQERERAASPPGPHGGDQGDDGSQQVGAGGDEDEERIEVDHHPVGGSVQRAATETVEGVPHPPNPPAGEAHPSPSTNSRGTEATP